MAGFLPHSNIACSKVNHQHHHGTPSAQNILGRSDRDPAGSLLIILEFTMNPVKVSSSEVGVQIKQIPRIVPNSQHR